MASMEDLEWTVCEESLDDIFANPKAKFPQIFKLNSGITSIDSKEYLEKDQIIVIHEKKTVVKLYATDGKEQPLRLPVSCPYNVRLRLPTGKEKKFDTIADLAKSDPLPKFVEVTKVVNLENVNVDDRLKVVIVEKAGDIPSFIHFRGSSGKHVKIAIDQDISFQLAVNDATEQSLSKIAEKSRELPVAAEFVKSDEIPETHTNLGVFKITKVFTEEVVIASANKSNEEYAVVFPLNSHIMFQKNSKLKLANDEEYRQLCVAASNVDTSEICNYLYVVDPANKETEYVIKYKRMLKLVTNDNQNSESDNDVKIESPTKEKHEEEFPLKVDQDQREIVKQAQKEKERLAKAEKERLKAERKKEKKEKKEKEKEEKKKKKNLVSQQSLASPASENLDEDMYIVPEAHPVPTSPTSPTNENDSGVESQSQWAMQLMNKVKKVRDHTRSVGFKSKKRSKLKKEDIVFDLTDNLDNNTASVNLDYTEFEDGAFSGSLYETLPCDMAYESLDLIAQAQRSLAPMPTESSGDSGFDEVDQAKIKAWRDTMVPPPLPGNHPHQNRIIANNNDDIYEVAVDSSAASAKDPSAAAWQNFYDLVQHSTNEISTWGMEDVESCLRDLRLSKYTRAFTDSQVDGQLLLDLDENVLRDLGLSFFEARKLRKFVFGWRPDAMRPESYPKLMGFESSNPCDWSEKDAAAHLRVIDITEFAEFCEINQVNGDLLKDICVDDTIMNSIITTRDRKLKTVKIKNYVVDRWRPKKKGEGNYTSYTPVAKKTSPKLKQSNSVAVPNEEKSQVTHAKSSPYSTQHRKVSDNAPLGIGKKAAGDAPLIARMKQQLEERKNEWEVRKSQIP